MSSAPLLGGGEPERAPSWLGRVVDTEEARAQLRFAVPMVLTSMAYYGIPLVSVMFSGHLGDVHLAGATLGNSWATVTGYAFVVRAHRVPHLASMLVRSVFSPVAAAAAS
jgi:MATE family multidrug resistance protein